jgi:hypothetical protein
VAVLDRDGVIVAVNKAWRDYSRANGGSGDFVGWNYLEVCRRGAISGSTRAARMLAGLTRILTGSSRDYGLAYECHGAIFRLRAMAISSADGPQVLISHEDITELVRARTAVRLAVANEARVAEELGQRLTAIGLALQLLRRDGANQKAISTIELALDEAKHELKRLRRSPPRISQDSGASASSLKARPR